MVRRILASVLGMVGLTIGLGCCHVAGFNDCERPSHGHGHGGAGCTNCGHRVAGTPDHAPTTDKVALAE
jgi:hypothetical protein